MPAIRLLLLRADQGEHRGGPSDVIGINPLPAGLAVIALNG
jgi:hypothetical protein